MTFNEALKASARQAYQDGQIRLIERIRTHGVVRRAERGCDRAEEMIADARELVCAAAIETGAMPAEGPKDDYDWGSLTELFVQLLKAMLELWKFFG